MHNRILKAMTLSILKESPICSLTASVRAQIAHVLYYPDCFLFPPHKYLCVCVLQNTQDHPPTASYVALSPMQANRYGQGSLGGDTVTKSVKDLG